MKNSSFPDASLSRRTFLAISAAIPAAIAAQVPVSGSAAVLIEQEGSRFSEFETARCCLENWKAMFGKV